MYCGKCGNNCDNGLTYCPKCGNALVTGSTIRKTVDHSQPFTIASWICAGISLVLGIACFVTTDLVAYNFIPGLLAVALGFYAKYRGARDALPFLGVADGIIGCVVLPILTLL